jgi:predicted RNA polymerase sigma factor
MRNHPAQPPSPPATRGIPLATPAASEAIDRLDAVLRVLYLVLNEGYTATAGPDLQRTELTVEAIRLTCQVHTALPADSESRRGWFYLGRSARSHSS